VSRHKFCLDVDVRSIRSLYLSNLFINIDPAIIYRHLLTLYRGYDDIGHEVLLLSRRFPNSAWTMQFRFMSYLLGRAGRTEVKTIVLMKLWI
jgi:hypothetical protein